MAIKELLARGKYKKNRLSIYDKHVFISEKDDKGGDRWFWLTRRTAIGIARKILETYGLKHGKD